MYTLVHTCTCTYVYMFHSWSTLEQPACSRCYGQCPQQSAVVCIHTLATATAAARLARLTLYTCISQPYTCTHSCTVPFSVPKSPYWCTSHACYNVLDTCTWHDLSIHLMYMYMHVYQWPIWYLYHVYMYVPGQALGQWMICFSTSHAYNIACVYFYSIQALVPVALSMYCTFE